MRLVVQKVTQASVQVDGASVGAIGAGFMVLVGAETGDTEEDVRYAADKLCGLRIFEDAQDKLNLSIRDVGGSILLVSQFTLLGDVRHGRRPSFIDAARPEIAEPMLETLRALIEANGIPVETGRFRTHMQVSLVNDGPTTILIDSKRSF